MRVILSLYFKVVRGKDWIDSVPTKRLWIYLLPTPQKFNTYC